LNASQQYVLGHSDAELRRLANQARVIDPITRRFLLSAGIGAGMRALDIGSGAGDVAMMLAELVGPRGSVVGTDLAETALAAAQLRVRTASLANVEFRKGDPAVMTFDQPFDVVVGRYVLQFMTDPAATLARLASHLRPGGVIVFHELDWSGARSMPTVPTYDLACRWVEDTIQRNFAEARLGPRLAPLFRKAGLPAATMQFEAAIASGSSAGDVVRLVTELVETLLPAMERSGVASRSEVDPVTLEARIMSEVGEDATVIARSEIAAWTRV
jgi:ubiquinone/menaquinone biosynthesis C-methylase UbiE